MMASATETLLLATGIDKAFPGVQALARVDFDLQAGEVHALVGENGAGKSTLTRILAGVETPDGGHMLLAGRPYEPKSRREAESQGVRMVMQELNLIGNLTVAENIFIERLPSRFGFINYGRLHQAAREAMEKVGLADLDPATPVRALGVGRQQMVEIAAGLSRRCRVLALDEPTASLTHSEVELLFTQIRRLQAEGVGIIYISHRIEEVLSIADRVTILRDGKVVGTHATNEVDADAVIRMMVGRDLGHESLAPGGTARRARPARGRASLRREGQGCLVRGLSRRDPGGGGTDGVGPHRDDAGDFRRRPARSRRGLSVRLGPACAHSDAQRRRPPRNCSAHRGSQGAGLVSLPGGAGEHVHHASAHI